MIALKSIRGLALLYMALVLRALASGPVPICEILSSCSPYSGKTLRVKGRYFANGHGRALTSECRKAEKGRTFAVPDWSRFRGVPDLSRITSYRGLNGAPSLIDGSITALVTVECVPRFRLSRDAETGADFGNGEGYNGLGAARLYLLRIDSVEPSRAP